MNNKEQAQPLLNTTRNSKDNTTMAAIAVFSSLGYLSMFLQQCKKGSDQYDVEEAVMHTALTFGLLASVATIIGVRLNKKEAGENVGHMTKAEYAQHIAIRMFKPHIDPRRFYAFGTLLSNIVLLPGDILCFGNLVTERLILQSLYTLLQFTALTVPQDSANAFLGWGVVKGAFQIVSLGVVAQNPQEFAPTIAANVLFTSAALTAIASGGSTKLADRRAETSTGLGA